MDGVEPVEVVAPAAELPPPLPTAVAAPAPPVPSVIHGSFRDRAAVRIALITAVVTLVIIMVLSPVPIVSSVAGLILPFVAGFLAVYVYRRGTGVTLSTGSGARIGWLVGIFCFVLVTILFTLFMALFAVPDVRAAMAESLSQKPGGHEMMETFTELLSSPLGILEPLIGFFVMLTILPVIGAAIGAMVLAPEQNERP